MKHARPASENIFSLEVLTVDGHEKRGAYVSSHLHLNVTYLLIADDSDALTVKPDENSGVRWFTPEGAIEASSEPWFRERIYKSSTPSSPHCGEGKKEQKKAARNERFTAIF